jgi:hypothetical protein
MPILTQTALVMAKVETTAGTDAAPTPAANAFLVVDPVFSVNPTVLDRNFAKPDFSTYASVVGRKLASVTFNVPMSGSGIAATSPSWAQLFAGCSMVETTGTAPASKVWTPITANPKTLTIYVYYDGLLHKMVGCMGTFSINAEAGNFGMASFTFTGGYVTPIASTFPTTAVLQDVTPSQVELANLAYGGDASLVVNAFTMEMANNIVPRSDVNSANGFRGVRISGRNPTGGIDPETEVTQSFWSSMETSALAAFSMRIGTVAGNLVRVTAPKSQIVGVGYGDRDGLRNYDLSLAFRRNAGNDEFTVAFE